MGSDQSQVRQHSITYFFLAGCPGMASQCDYTHVIEFLKLCAQINVPSTQVYAILPHGDQTIRDPYPSPRAGFPPLQIPKVYEDVVSTELTDITRTMLATISHFFADRKVEGVVLYYANHGHTDSLSLRGQDALQPADFAWLCKQACRSAPGSGKPFLVILDCCFSTAFVENLMPLLTFPSNAAFLTSGPEDCQASATVVSMDPTLVYPCPPDQSSSPAPEATAPIDKPTKTSKRPPTGESPEKLKRPAVAKRAKDPTEFPTPDLLDESESRLTDEPKEKPMPARPDKRSKKPKPAARDESREDSDEPAEESARAPRGGRARSARGPYVFGYRVQGSMFSRVLVPLLTYGLTSDVTLAELPAMMNHPTHPLKFGFEAALSPPCPADPEKAKGWVGHMSVRFFFPWAPIRPDTKSVAAPYEPFSTIIPALAVGALYDDISHFWHKSGDECTFHLAFVEIRRVRTESGAVQIEAVRRGLLDPEKPDENLILTHVNSTRGTLPRSPTPAHNPAPTALRYPIPEISQLFFQRAKAKQLAWFTGTVDPEWVRQFNAFIRTLDVPIAISDMRAIIRMAHFGFLMEDQEEFRQMVREARDAIVAPRPSTFE
jgi:hypothetical protein